MRNEFTAASPDCPGPPHCDLRALRVRRVSTALKRMLPLFCAGSLFGCATTAQVTNFSQATCAGEFRRDLGAILMEQGETGDVGAALAERAFSSLASGAFGPRPFLVASPSGTDYEFFVQKKPDACLLRLYGRRHGFVAYTNNLSYIATRPLTHCECAE